MIKLVHFRSWRDYTRHNETLKDYGEEPSINIPKDIITDLELMEGEWSFEELDKYIQERIGV